MLRRSTTTGRLSRDFTRCEVEGAERIPFRDDDQRVGSVDAAIGALRVLDVLQHGAGLLHALRIVGADLGAGILQRRDQRDRGRVAHVVGVGLEGQPQHGNGAAAHVAAADGDDLARHRPLALVVDGGDGLDDAAGRAEVVGRLHQGQRVLGKAGAAEARTGVEEFRADAVVEADAARDVLHVGAGLLAQVGDLVDEGDLGGEEGVGGVLDELGRAPPGEQQRRG